MTEDHNRRVMQMFHSGMDTFTIAYKLGRDECEIERALHQVMDKNYNSRTNPGLALQGE